MRCWRLGGEWGGHSACPRGASWNVYDCAFVRGAWRAGARTGRSPDTTLRCQGASGGFEVLSPLRWSLSTCCLTWGSPNVAHGPPSEELTFVVRVFHKGPQSALTQLSFFKVCLCLASFLGSAYGRARCAAISAKNCWTEFGDTEAGRQKYPLGRREEWTGNQPPRDRWCLGMQESRPGATIHTLNRKLMHRPSVFLYFPSNFFLIKNLTHACWRNLLVPLIL